MIPDDLPLTALAWAHWLAGPGRSYVFVGLMSLFLAAFVVAGVRRSAPEADAAPVFHPPRRPPGPGEEGWRTDAELAAVLLEAGCTLEAIQAYRRLLANDPADPDALFNLGHAYFRLRLHAQARACWRAVRRVEPMAEDARANLRLVSRLLKAEGAAGKAAGGRVPALAAGGEGGAAAP